MASKRSANTTFSTVYDLKKKKNKLLNFYADSDMPKAMTSCKTLHMAWVNDVDQVLFEYNRGEGVDAFKKEFNLKDAIWILAHVWTDIIAATLKNAWHNFWPASIFEDDDDELPLDFQGFHISGQKKVVSELMEFAKGMTGTVIAERLEEDEKVLDKLIKEKPRCMKQASLQDMFSNSSQKNTHKASTNENHEGPSATASPHMVCLASL
uniref:Uncharacterized protein n=1 Tax=Crocodylus porosus TaxID=8502 RepID=A0A7M4E129_CROPO